MYKFNILIFLIFFSTCSLKCNDYLNESTELFIGFYQNYMSPLKDPVSHCQFTPSCSEYAKNSINEYGILIGSTLAADRLMRCSGGHANKSDYPYSRGKFIDIPSNNSLFGDKKFWNLTFSASSILLNQVIPKDTLFNFAYHLFSKGDYNLSNFELNRIKFYSKNKSINETIELYIGINEFLQAKGIKALDNLSDIDNIENSDLKFKYFLLTYIISDFNNLNLYNINLCKKYLFENKSEIINKLLCYSYFKNDEIQPSINSINIIRNKIGNEKTDSIINFINLNFDQNSKSPLIAGIMSTIIPGSGYIYAGKLKEGLSAFVINSLLGIGIYSLFVNDNIGSGILTSLVAMPFYFGNIIGSANSAENENIKLKQITYSELRNVLNITFYFSPEQIKAFWE